MPPDRQTTRTLHTQRRPTVPEVRSKVPDDLRRPSLPRGLAWFAVTAGLYLITFAAILLAPWWPLQILLAILNGLCIATLFVTGHDACHGGLTPIRRLNPLLGRLAFLPSLTPYTTWEYAHNRIHHSYTNLRPHDYAWAPFSKAEYDSLPGWRRALERRYRSRSGAGVGLYYFIEYWLHHLIFLSPAERRQMKRPATYRLDLLLVACFAGAQVAAVVMWSAHAAGHTGPWSAFVSPAALLVTALLLPFAVWNWVMGFAIFQHHNHPRVAWFNDRREWDFFAAQVESTTHIVMPWYLELITGHIMQHTAHHVDSKIAMYRLTNSQHQLEQAYPAQVVVDHWSVPSFRLALSVCRLYDYTNHRWLNFDGTQTTEPNETLRALKQSAANPAPPAA